MHFNRTGTRTVRFYGRVTGMRKMHNYVLKILVITLLCEDLFEAQRQMGCCSDEYGL